MNPTIKRDPLYILIIFVLSAFLLNQLFRNGVFYSHDGEIHIARLAQFTSAIADKQIPVRWLPNWNFGFGYPAFVYIYSLPYYIGLILKAFALTYEQIFKVLLFLSLSFSGITFYYFAKSKFSKTAAIVGAVFYITAPYRFADIFERGALGETLAFIFAPLLFLMPHVLIKKPKKGFILTTIIIFAFITTHALTFLIFLPASIIYSVFIFKKNSKHYFAFFLSIAFGFFLASFQWIPMIFEQKYVDLGKTYYNLYLGHFITYNQLLRIPKEDINIGTGIQLGAAQILVILISTAFVIYKLFSRQKGKGIAIYFITVALVSSYLSTTLSKSIWESVSILPTVLFPWRFLALSIFSAAFLSSFIVQQARTFKLLVAIVFVIIAIVPSRHYLKSTGWHTHSDNFYVNYQDNQKLDYYFLPKGLVQNLDQIKIPLVSILGGAGQLEITKKQSNKLEVKANLNENSRILFHVINFPGWALTIDGKIAKIDENESGYSGIITADVPIGEHQVTLSFHETPVRQLANTLSLVSFLFLIVALVYGKFLSGHWALKVKQAR